MLALAAGWALLPPVAEAADPGRWAETGRSTIPITYYQGVTSDSSTNLFFDGIYTGLYRTDSQLRETVSNPNVIPPAVSAAPANGGEGYNHIGDITYDEGESGRLLLPLECYSPGQPNGGNTCGTGAIGVADPETLAWEYYVKLDPAFIPKAMWAEVSPDGNLLWTSSGNRLQAYDMDEIVAANASAPGGSGGLQPVLDYVGAVPPSGITGATFYRGRLYVAGQTNQPGQAADLFRVFSVDLTSQTTAQDEQLEIERQIVGESEGLDIFGSRGGVLHWQIQPFSPPEIPTFDPANGSLLHFVPVAGDVSDGDHDGVDDDDDACPAVPGGNASDGCSPPTAGDADNDGIADAPDNCVSVPNNDQYDADQDDLGDRCDPDEDGDAAPNTGDNCSGIGNPDQGNFDGDDRGDACDEDDDNDGRADFRDACPRAAGGATSDGCPVAVAADTTPPQTELSKARIKQGKRRATMSFGSDEPGSTFSCTLDRKRVRRCTSPKTLKRLSPGKHRFTVAARDAAGNVDPTPAVKRFTLGKKGSKR